MPRELEFRWEFDLPVPRERLWSFVSDTERVNRLAGLFPVHYEYEPLPGGGSRVHATASARGIRLRWIERPAEWLEPERFGFTREYEGGPFARLVSTVELLPGERPGATRLVQTIRVRPRNLFGRLLARYAIGVEARRGFERAYAAAEPWARGQDLPAVGSEGAAGRRLDELEIRGRFEEFGARVGSRELAGRLVRYLFDEPESETAILRPYRLAARWGFERRSLLRFFLHATKAGLLDLRWSLICPSCRRSKTSFPRLRDLEATGHCPSCNIRFGAEFDRSVEVSFSPAPLGLGLEVPEYCHAGPGNTPHWFGSWVVPPGEERRVRAAAGPGSWQFVSPQAGGGVYCSFSADPSLPSKARIELEPDGLRGVPPAMRSGEIELVLVRRGGLPEAEFRLARTEWADDTVTAAEVTSIQEFRDLFGSEILAPGACFSIQAMVFLFSDLVGSTAMYEAIGDATAFRLVREHFDLLQAIAAREGGALVKTIGDAVMAAFRDPALALRAAIEMQEEIRRLQDPRSGRSLELRIGLHRGPCIAMEANGRLDYFGTTVNLAARVQGAAGASEVAITEALLAGGGAAEVLRERRLASLREVCRFKGIDGEVTVHRVRLPAASPGAAGA